MTNNADEDKRAGIKTLTLVEELANHERAGVTELADHLSLPKSTVHYHLDLLYEKGFVVKEDGSYRLSLRLLNFGESTRNQIQLYDVAKPEVNQLAEMSGELAILMVEERGYGVYLHKAKGSNAIDIDAPIGRHAFLHNRALGKAILANKPEAEVQAIIDQHGLPQTSENTITDEEELSEELAEVRERGISYNDQESIDGLRGIGVPILGEDAVLGAVSIAGPTARMKEERFEEELPELLQRARNVIELTVQNK